MVGFVHSTDTPSSAPLPPHTRGTFGACVQVREFVTCQTMSVKLGGIFRGPIST